MKYEVKLEGKMDVTEYYCATLEVEASSSEEAIRIAKETPNRALNWALDGDASDGDIGYPGDIVVYNTEVECEIEETP